VQRDDEERDGRDYGGLHGHVFRTGACVLPRSPRKCKCGLLRCGQSNRGVSAKRLQRLERLSSRAKQ